MNCIQPTLQTTSLSKRNLRETLAIYERLQFKIATANNSRKREGGGKYYILRFDLYAILEDGSRHIIACTSSCPLTVRGRSPNHYATMDSGASSKRRATSAEKKTLSAKSKAIQRPAPPRIQINTYQPSDLKYSHFGPEQGLNPIQILPRAMDTSADDSFFSANLPSDPLLFNSIALDTNAWMAEINHNFAQLAQTFAEQEPLPRDAMIHSLNEFSLEEFPNSNKKLPPLNTLNLPMSSCDLVHFSSAGLISPNSLLRSFQQPF